jgi:type II secretory pathway pseudopilin PulG
MESLAHFSTEAPPVVACLYGEESAIREASSSGGFDVGAALVVAAVAIPNLLRSRMAANEASAVGSVRTVNTAQITYAATYPQRGFAPNLATLGPDSRNPTAASPEHADLINASLANEGCTEDAWCTKSGFRFRVTAVCKQHRCESYVVVATPVDSNTGGKNFCSTSDGVIRSKAVLPLTSAVSISECKTWAPLQ